MKSYDNLYDKLCSLENLQIAYRKARKGKRSKWYVQEFHKNLDEELIKLENELETMTYEPQPLKKIVVRYPKTRVVHASAFRDRVVHHALCNVIEPIFDKTFIHDSYANRKNKGTHVALERFDEFKRKISQNGRPVNKAVDNNIVIGYVLKADIKHYFDNVEHDILTKIVSKKIRDEKVLHLIRKILDNHDFKILGEGMPIGNLTSQFFANVYLNEMDYFVKHKLKAKYYIRYVDDFIILHQSKEQLNEWKDKLNDFLKDKLRLELHPEKSKIMPLHKGTKFLGFRMFYHYKLPKKSNMRTLKRRMKRFKDLYNKGEITEEEIHESLNGWLAYAEHGNTYKLRKKIIRRLRVNYNLPLKRK